VRFRAPILLAFLLLLIAPASVLGAEETEFSKNFKPLDGRDFQARSIIGAGGKHPVRQPAELELFFRTVETTGYGVLYPTLFWRVGCNGHDYYLYFDRQHRMYTRAPISSKRRCSEPKKREERWLGRFFAVHLTWTLRHGRLTLTSGERQIVLIGTRSPRTRPGSPG
jgi:hypothetical protein